MQLTVTAQSLSAKHRATKSRIFRHALWFAVLIVLAGVGAGRMGILPSQWLLFGSADQSVRTFSHQTAMLGIERSK